MKSVILTSFLLISGFLSYGQCTSESASLAERVTKSTLVVEGKVINQFCQWDVNHKNIYTIHKIEIFRIFKGSITTDTLRLVTEGGRIGNDMLKISPSLELFTGYEGIFMLVPNNINILGTGSMYKGTAATQSFIKYDVHMAEAYDINRIYTDIEVELYSSILSVTREPIVVVKQFNPSANKGRIRALSPPTISSISAINVTAGTSTVITINGSNFGATRGIGKVGFRDADYGDGRFYYAPTSWVYQLWSDTKIKVIVPPRAGTGKIRIVNNAGDYVESANNLVVEWSHENVLPPSSSSEPFYETAPRSTNGSGGYTLQYTEGFSANTDAVNSFVRALEEWRCETGINWVLGSDIDIDTLAQDSINTVRFTKFEDGRKAVCYSRYSSCRGSGGTMVWYLSELDVEFDSTVNWHYGTGTPASNEYDFESFAAHELGHGHQLGHVADSQSLMHFTIGNGQRRPDLVGSDIDAGDYYIKSKGQAGSCITGMTALPLGNCVIRVPTPSFSISTRVVCPNESILFTNGTIGDVQGYEWIFGEDASIARSSLSGPHSVSYSTPGIKEIMLISYNFLGRDTAIATVVIREVPIRVPEYLGADSACLGEFNMAVTSLADAVDYTWNVESGGIIVKDGINKITVRWDEPGLHVVTVGIQAVCGVGPINNIEVFVREPTVAGFESETESTTVKFYNRSTNSSSYLWTFGDGASSTEENPTHTYQEAMEYQVSLTATGDCKSNVFVRNIDLRSRLSVHELTKSFTVFPNPLIIGEVLTVSGESFDTYLVYTFSGKMIEQGAVNSNKINALIKSEGLYILVLQNSDGAAYHKLRVIN